MWPHFCFALALVALLAIPLFALPFWQLAKAQKQRECPPLVIILFSNPLGRRMPYEEV